jgi:hypothetical protein
MQDSAPTIHKPFLICICVGGLVALITAISLVVIPAYHIRTNVSLSVSFDVTTVILFFGFLFLARGGKEGGLISGSGMRTAIAGTVIIEYLILVGTVAYYGPTMAHEDLPPITQLMVSNFTTVVQFVIAFYFGSSAATQIFSQRGSRTQIQPSKASEAEHAVDKP